MNFSDKACIVFSLDQNLRKYNKKNLQTCAGVILMLIIKFQHFIITELSLILKYTISFKLYQQLRASVIFPVREEEIKQLIQDLNPLAQAASFCLEEVLKSSSPVQGHNVKFQLKLQNRKQNKTSSCMVTLHVPHIYGILMSNRR